MEKKNRIEKYYLTFSSRAEPSTTRANAAQHSTTQLRESGFQTSLLSLLFVTVFLIIYFSFFN